MEHIPPHRRLLRGHGDRKLVDPGIGFDLLTLLLYSLVREVAFDSRVVIECLVNFWQVHRTAVLYFYVNSTLFLSTTMDNSDISSDKTWNVHEQEFEAEEAKVFLGFIQQLSPFYNPSCPKYKNGRTTKLNALRTVTKQFRGTTDLVGRRLKTIQTRVGRYVLPQLSSMSDIKFRWCPYHFHFVFITRYVKCYVPSGSGVEDLKTIKVAPEYEHLRWMSPFIKTRATLSSLRHQDLKQSATAASQLQGEPASDSEAEPQTPASKANNESSIDIDESERPRPGYHISSSHSILYPPAFINGWMKGVPTKTTMRECFRICYTTSFK